MKVKKSSDVIRSLFLLSASPHVTINGTVLSIVKKLIYLGSTLTANNSLDA